MIDPYVPPYWNISGVIYSYRTIPDEFIYELDYLFIQSVSSNLNGSTFQCLIIADSNSKIYRSSIGTLSVISRIVPSNGKKYNYLAIIYNYIHS